MKFTLEKVRKLKPTETYCDIRVDELKKKVLKNNIWTKPIWIDSETKIVIDGHHRLRMAKILKLDIIPCFSFDYKKEVVLYSRDENVSLSHDDVITSGLSNNLMGYKKTRHKLSEELFETHIDINNLRISNDD